MTIDVNPCACTLYIVPCALYFVSTPEHFSPLWTPTPSHTPPKSLIPQPRPTPICGTRRALFTWSGPPIAT